MAIWHTPSDVRSRVSWLQLAGDNLNLWISTSRTRFKGQQVGSASLAIKLAERGLYKKSALTAGLGGRQPMGSNAEKYTFPVAS
mmetsp:Transcript_10555/g.23035  ORF Transcript_10555/g.23035 Transcript_10555/m.23035 type:complete len:84 (+) Transcript_10555:514-765(+)